MATAVEGSTTNARGIPTFPFMNNVSDYVKSIEEVEPTLQRFQEMVSKYTFMQQNVERRAGGLREKLPEMKDTLDTVKFLKEKRSAAVEPKVSEDDLEDEKQGSQDIEATFSLQDTLYAKATIRPAEVHEVYLWLGANVMVAYPLDEAEEMLQGKLDKARDSLKAAEEDLEFAIARVHNWDVGEKRRLRAAGKLKDGGKDKG
jgi:prefoldin subunit 5